MGTLGSMEDIGDNIGAQVSDRVEQLEERFEVEDRSSREGDVTRRIEHFTAALPSTTWLMLAGGSMVGSVVLKVLGKHAAANFVAEWVPTFLLIGIYNKLVKIAGSDRQMVY